MLHASYVDNNNVILCDVMTWQTKTLLGLKKGNCMHYEEQSNEFNFNFNPEHILGIFFSDISFIRSRTQDHLIKRPDVLIIILLPYEHMWLYYTKDAIY